MPLRLPTLLKPSSLLPFTKGAIWIIALNIFLNDNVFSIAPITGTSMKPTLSPNYDTKRESDVVFWNIWSAKHDVKRGDVLQFASPNEPEVLAVKRVVGLPGDTIVLDPKRRPRVAEGPELTAARAWDSWQGKAMVPPGHIWVEGDNWRKTSDSNWYGPISKSLITGKAVAVVWPRERFWSKPWEGWKGRSRVVEGRASGDWTKDGLPVELVEVGDIGLPEG